MSLIRPVQPCRRGTVLIVVAGISALLATISLAFLLRMRADGEEVRLMLMLTQNRMSLYAASNYILEAGRIGWDTNADVPNQVHHEAYGWIDVRDGQPGPKLSLSSASLFPIATIGRFPLEAWRRPPCAIGLDQVPNPIVTEVTNPGISRSDARYGRPFLRNIDPMPVQSATLTASALPSVAFADWVMGDRVGGISSGTPIMRPESQGLGWFRIYRDGPATFVITVGAGGTRGFKDWNEVVSGPWGDQTSLFGGQLVFESMLSGEVRQWFRAEWSAAIGGIQPAREAKQNSHGNYTFKQFGWELHGGQVYASRGNACGTFSFFQRLRHPPERW